MEYEEVILKFTNEVKARVLEDFEDNNMTSFNSNQFLVKRKMPIDYWLIGYLLSFAGEVEVIAPTCLKVEYDEKVEHMYNLIYKKS